MNKRQRKKKASKKRYRPFLIQLPGCLQSKSIYTTTVPIGLGKTPHPLLLSHLYHKI